MPISQVLSETRVPVKIWTDEVEESALEQLRRTANLPFIFKHLAVMPDVHTGMGATIGSVVATRGAIVPSCVGVDLGCGMMAVKTALNAEQVQEKIKEIRHSIERSIPVGFSDNRRFTPEVEAWMAANPIEGVSNNLAKKAVHQLGSLGGGNHFIEICLDAGNAVWVMLHSGSRGIGNILARKHIDTAKDLMKRYFIDLPDPDLAYLVQGTTEFDAYVKDLQWAQKFAFENRQEMMRRVLKDLGFALKMEQPLFRHFEVNCHHNYVDWENHFGVNVMVTRKGAVRAREGDYGIIPGSMGAKSFIVRGLGSLESFQSCSHGAGRRMSRTKAFSTFTQEDLEAQTLGVECRKDKGVLDEIPGAYKDIDKVMQNQSDLVEVVATLKQIMCIKG